MSYVPHSLARILDEIERLKHVRAGPVFKELLYKPVHIKCGIRIFFKDRYMQAVTLINSKSQLQVESWQVLAEKNSTITTPEEEE